jgi:hypothetical protein
LHFSFDPLPFGVGSTVDIVLPPAAGFLPDDLDEQQWAALRRFRPAGSEWLGPVTGWKALSVFGACPATKIAFGWLEDDLRFLKWL